MKETKKVFGDSSDIHQKLWARKKLKERRERNVNKKIRKSYFNQDKSD